MTNSNLRNAVDPSMHVDNSVMPVQLVRPLQLPLLPISIYGPGHHCPNQALKLGSRGWTWRAPPKPQNSANDIHTYHACRLHFNGAGPRLHDFPLPSGTGRYRYPSPFWFDRHPMTARLAEGGMDMVFTSASSVPEDGLRSCSLGRKSRTLGATCTNHWEFVLGPNCQDAWSTDNLRRCGLPAAAW